jgi:tetratricopeptide (TPR) repeat protein
MLLLFILPLTLWVYLPLRASQDPVLNWGDPSNWENFIIQITVQSFGGYFSPIKESFHRFIPHLRFFPSQFSWWILCLGLLAIPIFLWKKRIIFLFFTLIFAVNIIHSIRYTIVNIQDYYLQSFILVAILIGIGLSFITRLMPKFLKPIFILLLLLPLISYRTHHFQNNRTKFYFAYDYDINILRPLKENAIIFSEDIYDTFSLWYPLYVEERKKDVSLFSWMLLPCDWHVESIKKLHPNISLPFTKILNKDLKYLNLLAIKKERFEDTVSANLENFPIYVKFKINEESDVQNRYNLLPDGIFFRLLPKDFAKDKLKKELDKGPQLLLRGINDKKIFKDRIIIPEYALIFNERGLIYQGMDIKKAIIEYKKALAIDPFYLSSLLNLGFVYVNNGDYDKAIKSFKKVLKKNPNYNPSLTHCGLGLVYQNKGMIDEAIRKYKMALDIDPNNILAKQSLQTIEQKNLLAKD